MSQAIAYAETSLIEALHAPGSPAVVTATELRRRYGEGDTAVDALLGIDVEIAKGQLTAVMGPSGSGKSTLMHLLAGLDQPTAGTVTIDGTEITRLKDAELTRLRRNQVGFVFQFFNLLPMLSAEENVLLPLSIAGEKPDKAWIEELLGRVGLRERRKHRPAELSGGQQQRVAVARALVARPAVVFADEPTGNLDSRTGTEILDLLSEAVSDYGQTLVMVTHDVRAATIADRILYLADGRIRKDVGASTAAGDRGRGRGGELAVTSVALKGLAGRKLRAFLTALAIVLGVAMVSGTYVLTDTIKSAFDQIFAGSYENTAAVVTGKSTVSFAQSGAPTVPASVLAKVRALPDVQSATGQIFNLNDSSDYGKLIGRDGKPLGSSGNPTFAFGFDPAAGELNPMSLTDGRWASGPHQIVIDSSSAKQGDFAVGDTIGASVEGPIKQYRIVGIAKFGSVDSLGGATIAIFDTRTAQGLLGKPGYDLIAVSAKPGVSPEKLVGDIRPLLPSSAQVKTGAEQAKASAKDISEFTNFIQYFLLAFGIVALFVGAFVIFNTLSITVAQRTRELATLRTLGASRRQVRRSVLVEGFVIGVLASALGLALGVALAKGLSALMAAMSLDLPKAGTVFEARTVIVSMLLGTIVTLVASIAPAMKATRVPPIAAVREGATLPKGRFSSYRTAVSLSVVALSLALLGYGLFADGIAAGPRLLSLARRRARAVRRRRAGGVEGRTAAGVGARPAVRTVRRLRRPGPPERDAQPAAHGGHGCGADDRPRARHYGGDAGQGPGRLRPGLAPPSGAGRLRGHLQERLGRVLPRGGRRGRRRSGRDRRLERAQRAGEGRR